MRMNKETREEHPARRLAPHEAAGYEGVASALLPDALTRSHLLPSPRQPLRLTLTCCSFCSQTTVLDKALCKIEVLSGTATPSREKQATRPGRTTPSPGRAEPALADRDGAVAFVASLGVRVISTSAEPPARVLWAHIQLSLILNPPMFSTLV